MSVGRLLQQAAAGAGGDPDFADVSLLLDGDGTSGDQNETFTDSSTNGFTVTESGSVVQGSFSPYSSSNPRDITTDGGSGYFDLANTAYLSFSGGASTISDITISGWVYPKTMAPQAGNAYPRVFAAGNFLIYVRDDDIRIYNGGEKVQAPIDNNEWTYFVAQRSSNTWTLYINGVSQGTASDSSNITLNSTNYIGSNGASNYFTGYIADLRITTSGSTSTAVPTSPVSAVTNTEMLLNFQDAGIYDRSGINNLDTVGNSQIDTAVKKYGTGSMQFDETGDYLAIDSNSFVPLGTGDFTIECWVYFLAVASNGQGVFQLSSGYLNAQDGIGPGIGTYNGSGKWHIYYGAGSNQNTTIGSAVSAPSQNTWYHVSFVKTSGVIKIFIDGTQIGSDISSTNNYTNTYLTIGGWYSTGYLLNGYIDDFRITKGIARYTANFTPPDAALPKF